MSWPHFYSCWSSQEHRAHGAFLVAFQPGFNINIVAPSLPSTQQIHSKSNLSFNWHEVLCPLAGRELQYLMAVSYFWAWRTRSALKSIKSVAASLKCFFVDHKGFLCSRFLFSFLLQRFLGVISACLCCRCNGYASLHHISVLINLSLSIRLCVIQSCCKSVACWSEARRKRNSPHTNATATQSSSGREQVLGAWLFRRWSLWFFPMYQCLLDPFHCSFRVSGGVSAAKLHLINRKSIPFHTNRLPLTLAAVNAIEATTMAPLLNFPQSLYQQ